jgi:hypothetical protein
MNDIGRWRTLADSFPILAEMVQNRRLPADYTPELLIDLYRSSGASTGEHSIFGFLLHVWNRYDFDFPLADVQIWNEAHQRAFIAWANGRTLGEPLRYF